MSVNGKRKGSAFEREICKRLSLWVSDQKQEDCFWRSAISGGRATVAHKRGKRMAAQAGDISAVHELGIPLINKCLIECKAYQDINFMGILTKKGKLVEFWAEAKKQGRRYNKEPMLIVRQNQKPVFVCLTSKGRDLFGPIHRIIWVPLLNMNIYLLDDFLKQAVKP